MKRVILIIALMAIVAPATAVHAQGFLPDCDKTRYVTSGGQDVSAQDYQTDMGQISEVYTTNKCGLNDFVQIFINLADWGLTVVAGITVFFLIWGAFDWIVAGGRSTMVDEGKKKITGALMGLIVVLGAWVFIGFVMGALTGNLSGYVFPGSDSQRLWFGDKSSCKSTYTTPCTVSATTTIKNGCGDPATTEFGDIAQIQKRLADHLCEVGSADGCYGSKTASAVSAFQLANGLPQTGEVDQSTYNKLIAGGAPCGFDPNSVPLLGCCLPKRSTPNMSQQCIEGIYDNQCNGQQYGSPAVEYYFKAGHCSTQDCGNFIIDFDDLTPLL